MKFKGDKITLIRVIHYARRQLYSKSIAFVYESKFYQQPAIKEGKAIVSVAKLEDLNDLINIRGDYWGESASTRISSGEICFVAKIDGKDVGCLWATFNHVWIPWVGYNLVLDDVTVGATDAYVVPEWRGKGIYTQLYSSFIDHFYKLKYSRFFGFIGPDNALSIAVHNKLGMSKIVMEIQARRFFGIMVHKVINR